MELRGRPDDKEIETRDPTGTSTNRRQETTPKKQTKQNKTNWGVL
jgi:hypothetical protein